MLLFPLLPLSCSLTAFISHLDAFEKVHLGLVVQTCNPSLLKDEDGGLQVEGQPGQLIQILFQP